MSNLIQKIIEWWQTPSPRWMQESANYVLPGMIVLGIFIVGGLHSMIFPYLFHTFPWGRIEPSDPMDTIPYACLRFLIGGAFWLIVTIRWWRRKFS